MLLFSWRARWVNRKHLGTVWADIEGLHFRSLADDSIDMKWANVTEVDDIANRDLVNHRGRFNFIHPMNGIEVLERSGRSILIFERISDYEVLVNEISSKVTTEPEVAGNAIT